MEQEVLAFSNSLAMWLCIAPLMAVIFSQVILIRRRAVKTAAQMPELQLSKEQCSLAFRTGFLTAIGPAISSFIIIIAMSAVVGNPITWSRCSIIASPSTEMRASAFAAEAMGIDLSKTGFTSMTAYANALWVMAMNGCGWLLFCLIFTDKISIVTEKLVKVSKVGLEVFASAAIIACMSYLTSSSILSGGAVACTWFAAAIIELILTPFLKNHPKLKEWNIGIAMLGGMFAGSFYKNFIVK